MVQSVLAEHGVVLISWQHERIHKLAEHIFASKPPAPPIPKDWPGDRFDIVWVFTPSASGRWGFVQMPQQLLSGDARSVLKQ